MYFPHIFHHGVVSGVAASCRLLLMDIASRLLIDCGLFQGAEGKTNHDVRVEGWRA